MVKAQGENYVDAYNSMLTGALVKACIKPYRLTQWAIMELCPGRVIEGIRGGDIWTRVFEVWVEILKGTGIGENNPFMSRDEEILNKGIWGGPKRVVPRDGRRFG